MICLRAVSKSFGQGNVLEGVSFVIQPGEFVCIVGPSGAGKSTLLSLLTGAERVTTGSISIDDVELRMIPSGAMRIFRRKLGIVFQDYKLLANRTVAENIAFPLEVCGAADETIMRRVDELLRRMHLSKRADALPGELSGGEKARTAIARAIAHQPIILLADEPTQNLDPQQAIEVLQIFRDINAEGATVIIATHDPQLVDVLQTRVIELDHGKIVRDSVGGYAKHNQTPARVFDARTRPVETVPVATESVKKTGARKIKVTAIHS